MAVGSGKGDLGPPDVLLRTVAVGHDRLQSAAVGRAHVDGGPLTHGTTPPDGLECYECVKPLAAACGQLGQLNEARAALAAARRYVEVVSVADYAMASDYRPGAELDFLLEGLALAGLPRESIPREE